jgi:hypothetical protein
MDVAALAQLLHETQEHHGSFEAIPQRTAGGTGTRRTWTHASAETPRAKASAAAGRYMAEVRNVVVSPVCLRTGPFAETPASGVVSAQPPSSVGQMPTPNLRRSP